MGQVADGSLAPSTGRVARKERRILAFGGPKARSLRDAREVLTTHLDTAARLASVLRSKILAAGLASLVAARPAHAQLELYSVADPQGTLGAAVAIDAGLAVIGAPLADFAGAESGAARVIDVETGQLLHILSPGDATAGQRFGFRVAIAGDLILVGAPFDDVAGADSGSAYVFDAGSGQQLVKLTPPFGAAGDQFGQALALDGDLALVGATAADGVGPNTGAVYVFDAPAGQHLFELAAPDSQAQDQFGNALTAHGGFALVGARRHDEGGLQAGSSYLFDLATGGFVSELRPSDSQPGQNYGASMSMDASHIVVGAIQDLGPGPTEGAVYVFDRNSLQELHKLTPTDPVATGLFGQGLDLWQGRALIGASHQEGNDGYVYLFDVVSGEQLFMHRSEATPGALYGVSLGYEGDRALVGAPGHAGGSGVVFGLLPETPLGQVHCPGELNSTGEPGRLEAAGMLDAQANQLFLLATDLPAGQFGFFFTSQVPGFVVGPGGSQGNLCLGGPLARFNAVIPNAGPGGFFQLRVDTNAIPTQPASAIQAGQTWFFQAWYRDGNPQPTSNFTGAAAVLFR